ncbi:MAG: metallophosphoesterase [Aquabacterium sp.]|nr:metallophosphoesterase [Aquabacterium sp.]
MNPGTIVHLSDLHFGADGQMAVWKSLKDYLSQDVPDLIVVTGDIVDSPTKENFKLAREQFDQFQSRHPRKFLVCPGNHDRHWRGNATGPFTRWFSSFKKAQDAAPWFTEAFAGHVSQPDQYEDLRFRVGSFDWCIRFAGVDSAINVKYVAQGFVTPEDLQKLSCLTQETRDVDAVFVLMHHHLLPIAANEKIAQSVTGIVAGTTVVNAGMTLATMVRSQVNVVLHGHEHQRNLARYATFGSGQAETVVMGAGSSTGVVTFGHCDLNKASANVIELREDQSVWVKELRFEGGWSVHNETEICIVPTLGLRRSKFFRKAGSERFPPTSEVIKHVRFTPQRDALVHETRNDWLIKGGEFGIATRNRSGFPVEPEIKLTLPINIKVRPISPNGFERTDEPGCYIYRLGLSTPSPTLALHIDISYEWIDGARLCRQDLELNPQGQRGLFREEGYEFVAISVTNDLRAFQLHAHLPAGFWPNVGGENVKVFVQDMSKNTPPVERAYLKEHLSTSGPGVLSLSVPYPMTGFRYFMAWQLLDGPSATPRAMEMREILRVKANAALNAFLAGIQAAPWADLVSAALYIPEEASGGTPMVRRIAHVTAGRAVQQIPPECVSLRGKEVVYLHAWWDGDGIGFSQAGIQPDAQALEAGVLPSERWLFVLPVRELSARPGAVPLALIRIGISDAISQHGLAVPTAAEHFTAFWDKGLVSLLNVASA